MMIPKDVTPEHIIDFEEIARNSYRLIEEARAQRRSAALARLQSRFDRAGMSLSALGAADRELAIEHETIGDRRYKFVLYEDGHVAVGPMRRFPSAAQIVAYAGIDAISPHGLASELVKAFERSTNFSQKLNEMERERVRRLNLGLGIGR